MLDVIVRAGADDEAVARSLLPLVEGVIDGLVGRVVVLGGKDDARLRRLAEGSGAVHVAGAGWPAAAVDAALRGERVLALEAGVLLPRGWPGLLADQLETPRALALLPVGAAQARVLRLGQALGLRPRCTALVVDRAAARAPELAGRWRAPHGALILPIALGRWP